MNSLASDRQDLEQASLWSRSAQFHALRRTASRMTGIARRLLLRVAGDSDAQRLLAVSHRRLVEAEASHAEALRRLELAEEIAHIGNWRLSLPDETLTWSDEVYRIHGLDKADYQPTLHTAIAAYHLDDQPIVADAVARARRQRSCFDISVRLVRPDGSVRHVLSRGRVQAGADGELTAIFGVFVDITEQKAIEAALFRAHEDAERANQKLAEMARLDGLTGLANRREFDHALDREFRRAMRSGRPLGLIMIDVDNFKQFNDLYGHPSGDACLRALAEMMPLYVTRPGDVVARYGGEEIAVLLPGCDAAGTRAVAQTLAQAVRDLAIPHQDSPGGIVTISAGVEAVQPMLHHDLAAELVQRADIALYAAKRDGRNTVRWYGEIHPFGTGALAG